MASRKRTFAIILGASTLILIILAILKLSFFRVSATSMEATLKDGDYVLVETAFKLKKTTQTFNRGDIVVFRAPDGRAMLLIKRIVAIGGDRIRIENGNVFVNDSMLTEPYRDGTMHEPLLENWPLVWNSGYKPRNVVVPAGSYFVLGDNRTRSDDSRDWGAVRGSAIVGSVLAVSRGMDVTFVKETSTDK